MISNELVNIRIMMISSDDIAAFVASTREILFYMGSDKQSIIKIHQIWLRMTAFRRASYICIILTLAVTR
jgi:hypothetical protein